MVGLVVAHLHQMVFLTLAAVDFEILDSRPFSQDPCHLDMVPTYLHANEYEAIFMVIPIRAGWTHFEWDECSSN